MVWVKSHFKDGVSFITVDSTIMYPTLNYGDLIIVQGVVNACDKEPGDIIVFHEWTFYNGDLIVCRAVEKTIGDGSYYFRTQGDAVGSKDNWKVKESDVVGRYVGKVPWLGHVPLFMREVVFPFLSTPAGFLIMILVIIGLMLLNNIPSRKERAEA